MTDALRSAATLTTLAVLLVAGAAWGWSAFTSPLPDAPDVADPPVCEVRTVEAGTKVFRSDVTVSVYNAGGQSGLAGETMDALVDAGFSRGESGNAPVDMQVRYARILGDAKSNPAVRLVRRHLNGSPAVSPDAAFDAPGVLVVVGNDFRGVGNGPRRVRAKQLAEICGPVVQ